LILALPLAFLAIIAGLSVGFARAWAYEFRFLMSLGDDAFPGAFDKVVWAVLLILAPPVGLHMFRSYRLAHWPRTKAKTAYDLS
jgi:hypothetical protein